MSEKMLKFVNIDMQMPAKRTSDVRTEDFKKYIIDSFTIRLRNNPVDAHNAVFPFVKFIVLYIITSLIG